MTNTCIIERSFNAKYPSGFKQCKDTENEEQPAEWTYYLYAGGNAVVELNESGDVISTNIFCAGWPGGEADG